MTSDATRSLLEALRHEADLSEKGIDFMEDEDLANETRVQIGLLRDAATTIERLDAGLEELLSVSERMRGGDPKLDPEQWYAARDYARVVLENKPDHVSKEAAAQVREDAATTSSTEGGS